MHDDEETKVGEEDMSDLHEVSEVETPEEEEEELLPGEEEEETEEDPELSFEKEFLAYTQGDDSEY